MCEEGAVAASTQQPPAIPTAPWRKQHTYAALVHHGLNQFSPNALYVHQAGGYTPHLVNTGIHSAQQTRGNRKETDPDRDCDFHHECKTHSVATEQPFTDRSAPSVILAIVSFAGLCPLALAHTRLIRHRRNKAWLSSTSPHHDCQHVKNLRNSPGTWISTSTRCDSSTGVRPPACTGLFNNTAFISQHWIFKETFRPVSTIICITFGRSRRPKRRSLPRVRVIVVLKYLVVCHVDSCWRYRSRFLSATLAAQSWRYRGASVELVFERRLWTGGSFPSLGWRPAAAPLVVSSPSSITTSQEDEPLPGKMVFNHSQNLLICRRF